MHSTNIHSSFSKWGPTEQQKEVDRCEEHKKQNTARHFSAHWIKRIKVYTQLYKRWRFGPGRAGPGRAGRRFTYGICTDVWVSMDGPAAPVCGHPWKKQHNDDIIIIQPMSCVHILTDVCVGTVNNTLVNKENMTSSCHIHPEMAEYLI